ncbi:hypothetical protein [Caldiplasma sukawensis]
MGKFIAYVVGLFTMILFSFYFLSQYYSVLIEGYYPYLGPGLIFFVSILNELFTSPFNNVYLLPILVLCGALTGLAAGKWTRAFTSSVAVFLSLFELLSASILSIILYIGEFNNLISGNAQFLPQNKMIAIPGHGSLAAIKGEPVFYKFFKTISALFGSASPQVSGVSTQNSFSQVKISTVLASFESTISSFTINLIINFIIFVVVAIITGYGISKLSGGKHDSKGYRKFSKKSLIVLIALFLSLSAFYASEPNMIYTDVKVSEMTSGNAEFVPIYSNNTLNETYVFPDNIIYNVVVNYSSQDIKIQIGDFSNTSVTNVNSKITVISESNNFTKNRVINLISNSTIASFNEKKIFLNDSVLPYFNNDSYYFPCISYEINRTLYNFTSWNSIIYLKNISFFSSINYVLYSDFYVLDYAIHETIFDYRISGDIYLFDVLIILMIVADAGLEIRNYLKNKNR